uniref:EF-hand domain-containing protein n=1 Tax=Paramoeba aestuarina TaxID=180227 RepID=A0A7S4PLY3_9EUKA
MGVSQSLKKEDLDELQKQSHFHKKELQTMYKQFKKEAPNSEIPKADFVEVLQQMGISDPLLHDVIFKALDRKREDKITFQDLVFALSIMARGTKEERIDFAFSMYDLDNTGYITRKNMLDIVTSFFNLVGPQLALSGKKYESPEELVDDFFVLLDLDRDDHISLEEYKQGAVNHPGITQGLLLWDS